MSKKEASNYSVGYQAYLVPYNRLTNEQRVKVPYVNIERGGQPNAELLNEKLIGFKNGGNIKRRFK